MGERRSRYPSAGIVDKEGKRSSERSGLQIHIDRSCFVDAVEQHPRQELRASRTKA